MRIARFMVTSLLMVALLSLAFMTAFAENQGYSRFNNPGKGHDWDWYGDKEYNENDNSNVMHNENGYKNHLPFGVPEIE